MGRVAITPSEGMARLLRERRKQLGLTLRDVEERSAKLGHPIPFTTLAKAERGRADPGLRRLHVLLKIYEIPFRLAEDVLELDAFAAQRPVEGRPPQAVYEEALEQWKSGDLQGGFAGLAALRALDPTDTSGRLERQKGLVSLAITIGSLGRYRLSKQIIDELLVERLEPEVLVSVLVQAAVCWHSLGSSEAALAFLARADQHLGPRDHRRAWVLHQRAMTLAALGRLDEAEHAVQDAMEAYRQADDTYGVCRCRGMSFRLHMKRGDHAIAEQVASQALDEARAHGYGRLVRSRQIDIGEARVQGGDIEAGIAILSEALAEAIRAQDSHCQFYAHYHLWKARTRAGDPGRAEMELQAARYFVRFVDAASPEVEDLRQGGTTG